jgi:hypothetical protein
MVNAAGHFGGGFFGEGDAQYFLWLLHAAQQFE